MATVESLVLELDAKIDGYVSKMNEAEGTTTSKTKKMTEGIKEVATAFAGATASAFVLVKQLAANAKELSNNAQMARLSIKEFQSLASAYKTVGIDADKFADISKDMVDRVGDFLQTGGGPLADFFENVAPKIGLTAKELKGLSGNDALQAVKNAMDEVNLSAEEQVFHFEALASDSSKLIPLMANQGKELNRLTKHYDQFNNSISATDVDNLTALDKLFSDMADTVTNDLTRSVSGFSSVIADVAITGKALFDKLGESIVGELTNAFREVEIAAKEAQRFLADTFGIGPNVSVIDAEIQNLRLLDKLLDSGHDANLAAIDVEKEARKKAHEEHIRQLGEVRAKQLEDVAPHSDISSEDESPEVAAAREKAAKLKEIDAEAAVAEVEVMVEASARRLNASKQEATDAKFRKQWASEDAANTEASEARKLKAKQSFVTAASAVNAAFFNDNKAIGAGLIVANTAIGVSEGVKLGFPMAIPAVAYALATGKMALDGLNSASKGGGSIGGGASAPTAAPSQQIEISSGILDTGEGATSGGATIKFDIDSGDDLMDAIAGKFNEGLANSRFTLSEGS